MRTKIWRSSSLSCPGPPGSRTLPTWLPAFFVTVFLAAGFFATAFLVVFFKVGLDAAFPVFVPAAAVPAPFAAEAFFLVATFDVTGFAVGFKDSEESALFRLTLVFLDLAALGAVFTGFSLGSLCCRHSCSPEVAVRSTFIMNADPKVKARTSRAHGKFVLRWSYDVGNELSSYILK